MTITLKSEFKLDAFQALDALFANDESSAAWQDAFAALAFHTSNTAAASLYIAKGRGADYPCLKRFSQLRVGDLYISGATSLTVVFTGLYGVYVERPNGEVLRIPTATKGAVVVRGHVDRSAYDDTELRERVESLLVLTAQQTDSDGENEVAPCVTGLS